MKKFRFSALLAASVLLCAGFGGCAAKQPLAGDTVLLTIDGNAVTVDEYRADYLAAKVQFDGGDEAYWKDHAADKEVLKTSVLAQMQNRRAVETLLAENNVELTEDDKASVTEQLQSLKSYLGGEENYRKALEENYLTEESYRELIELSQRRNRYIYETEKEKIQKNFVRAKHVLVSFDKVADDEAADRREKLAKAQDIAARAKNGEDFDALVREYGEDPGMEREPGGYYFTTGKMVKSFEETTFALQENEISDPVETDYGYHIILRLPMEEQYLINHLAELLTGEYYAAVNAEVEEKVAAQKVEYSDAYNAVDIATIR